MGRPVRIRKKKSFMFTTRHYSFMSIMGIVIAIFCLGVIITSVFHSYNSAGEVGAGFGLIGLLTLILNAIGIISGVTSLKERDIYITPSIIAIVLNSLMVLAWIIMIIISAIAG